MEHAKLLSRDELKKIVAGDPGSNPCTETCYGTGSCTQQCEEMYACYEDNCTDCYGYDTLQEAACYWEVQELKQNCLDNC